MWLQSCANNQQSNIYKYFLMNISKIFDNKSYQELQDYFMFNIFE